MFINVVFPAVLSDEALPHVLDAGVCVQHIVHYDLPSTKTEFRSRLALFYTAMKWYVNITATPAWYVEASLWYTTVTNHCSDHVSHKVCCSLVPRVPCSGTRTLKLCRRGEPGIFCHVKSTKGRERVERPQLCMGTRNMQEKE